MIYFNNLYSGIEFSDQNTIKEWLNSVILNEAKTAGELNFVFVDDKKIIQINRDFLKHDFFTDIITFPTSVNDTIISGEIYVSVERIIENSKTIKVSFGNEFARVLVHGILHLLGYNDHTDAEIELIRSKEDYYLHLLPKISF